MLTRSESLALIKQAVGLVEEARLSVKRTSGGLDQSNLGQFLTPWPTARLMASMIEDVPSELSLLDPGAGVGTLTLAAVAELCARPEPPKSIHSTVYEVDERLIAQLRTTLENCTRICSEVGTSFKFNLVTGDFIRGGLREQELTVFENPNRYNLILLNPPYKKLSSDSAEKGLLSTNGISVNNYYSAFLWLATNLVVDLGQVIAITPRSFCNGPYFKPLRMQLYAHMTFRRVHIFDSRSKAFKDDAVLQENIIYSMQRRRHGTDDTVTIIGSSGPEDQVQTLLDMSYSSFLRPDDPEKVLHIVTDSNGLAVLEHVGAFTSTLDDLGLRVSTGKVVDFRSRQFIREAPSPTTVPLIYPTHIRRGRIVWPSDKNVTTSIEDWPESQDLLIRNSTYVLTKRFSSKEEKRRIVAGLLNPRAFNVDRVGLENHINYFHANGEGLEPKLARGLTAYLNSTLVDQYFRLFNGHTQVNAGDLKMLPFPSSEQLTALSALVGDGLADQKLIDMSLDSIISSTSSPIRTMGKIEDALGILKKIGMPRDQQNERSALTMLALTSLAPDTEWSEAQSPLRGITEMMEFFEKVYGKRYAPNTRETIRRYTVHQFVQEGLAVANPDDPRRAVNSPNYVYQVTEPMLKLVRSFGTVGWEEALRRFAEYQTAYKEQYQETRSLNRIAVRLLDGSLLDLSAGGQNLLIKKIIEEFGPRFTPNGRVLYVGDAEEKLKCFDEESFNALGLRFDMHGKMPDVVIHFQDKNWLLLIEAVTSHGPMDKKRRRELQNLFKKSQAGLVYVTAFESRTEMVRYLKDLAWETEVWIAEDPDHMIHFNGERFLGPYQ